MILHITPENEYLQKYGHDGHDEYIIPIEQSCTSKLLTSKHAECTNQIIL